MANLAPSRPPCFCFAETQITGLVPVLRRLSSAVPRGSFRSTQKSTSGAADGHRPGLDGLPGRLVPGIGVVDDDDPGTAAPCQVGRRRQSGPALGRPVEGNDHVLVHHDILAGSVPRRPGPVVHSGHSATFTLHLALERRRPQRRTRAGASLGPWARRSHHGPRRGGDHASVVRQSGPPAPADRHPRELTASADLDTPDRPAQARVPTWSPRRWPPAVGRLERRLGCVP